jgi:co-chaperonin GroES (HSP10)
MLKVFGPRVVIRPVQEEYKGLVVLPPGMGRNNHSIGEVIKLGDGKISGKPDWVSELAEGQIVMFQVNDYMLQSTSFTYNKQACLNLSQSDMIARLTDKVVKLKSFTVLGYWVLLQPFTTRSKESRIVVPGNVQETSEFQRFRLLQKGSKTELDVEIGQEVIVDKGKINVLSIDGTNLFYMASTYVLGATEDTENGSLIERPAGRLISSN